jgi:hypothetical protein
VQELYTVAVQLDEQAVVWAPYSAAGGDAAGSQLDSLISYVLYRSFTHMGVSSKSMYKQYTAATGGSAAKHLSVVGRWTGCLHLPCVKAVHVMQGVVECAVERCTHSSVGTTWVLELNMGDSRMEHVQCAACVFW